MVRRSALAAVIASLAISADASAAGVFIADPPSSAYVEEIRAAVAVDPSGATTWVGARVVGAADTLVWIVPRESNTAVDLATSAWLDALEDGTAPRVVAPKETGCEGPAESVAGGDFPPSSALTGKRLVASDAELAALEADWGVHVDVQERVALLASIADGGELVAIRWNPPVGTSATPVLRLRGTGATLPLQLTRADAQPIDVTVTLIADARASAPFLSLVAIADAEIGWPGGGDSYRGARDALLAAGTSARFVLESTSDKALTAGEWIAGGGKSPSVADAFVRRAVLRGELTGDVGQLTATLAPALGGASPFVAPCPRGDLFSGASCPDGASFGEVVLGRADDLAFALAGVPKSRWVTRLYGRIPAGSRGKAVTLSQAAGPAMPVLRRATARGCATATPPGSSGGGTINGGGEGAGTVPPPDEEPLDRDNTQSESQSQSSVGVDVGCDSSSAESCSSDSSDSDSGCSSDSSEADDGCSSDSSDSGDSCSGDSGSDDGCGSSDGGSESSCDSSEGGGGDGCSGGDGSTSGGCSSGGSGSDCTVSRGTKKRPSKWAFLGLALAFPLRRWTKKRAAS